MTEECPKCKSLNISKTEDIGGVAVEYNYEFNEYTKTYEWEEANQDWYGECKITFECNDCKEKWQ